MPNGLKNDKGITNRNEEKIRKYRLDQLRGYSCRYTICPPSVPKHFGDGRLLVIMALEIIWVTTLWLGVFAKLMSESVKEYISHYTNWIWTFNAVYYTIDLIMITRRTRVGEKHWLLFAFWPFAMNVWLMALLVFSMLMSNPETITENFKENGGDFTPGQVFYADRLFHVVPTWFELVYFLLRIIDFRVLFKKAFGKHIKNIWKGSRNLADYTIFLYIAFESFIGTMFFFVYYNSFDFKLVYGVNTQVWLGIIVLLVVMVSTIWIPIILLSPLVTIQLNYYEDSWSDGIGMPSVQDVTEFYRLNPRARGKSLYDIPREDKNSSGPSHRYVSV